MKKITYLILSLLILTIGCTQNNKNSDNLKFPKPIGFVNDFEKILSTDQLNNLNELVSDYEKKTSNQITIVTIDSFSPYEEIGTYAKELGNEWGVGQKDKNNGLIILLSSKLHSSFISTGLSTQKIITDSICKSIVENSMVPEFKNAAFYEGLKKGTEEIIKIWDTN